MQTILAFETSCDDTAVAIVNSAGSVLGEAIYSQLKHAAFGGVVPEVGSRAHIEQVLAVTKSAFAMARISLSDIDVVAATFAPGLVGPLLVGAQFAKGLAQARTIPLVAIHHIEGHILAGFGDNGFPPPPFLALIVSGGHTALYAADEDYSFKTIGETLDDAAGEAFDKVGRALGLSYPAGKAIDELAQDGESDRFILPIAMRYEDNFNFSFSGLKTKALDIIKAHAPLDERALRDFCLSLNKAIGSALAQRAIKAACSLGLKSIVIGGGVAANSFLRAELVRMCQEHGISLYLPEKRYCTDNAVMIGRAAIIRVRQGRFAESSLDVLATLAVEQAGELSSRS